jgi:hypothetical protein
VRVTRAARNGTAPRARPLSPPRQTVQFHRVRHLRASGRPKAAATVSRTNGGRTMHVGGAKVFSEEHKARPVREFRQNKSPANFKCSNEEPTPRVGAHCCEIKAQSDSAAISEREARMFWFVRRALRALRAPLRRPLEPLLWFAAALSAKDAWVRAPPVHEHARVPPRTASAPASTCHALSWSSDGRPRARADPPSRPRARPSRPRGSSSRFPRADPRRSRRPRARVARARASLRANPGPARDAPGPRRPKKAPPPRGRARADACAAARPF